MTVFLCFFYYVDSSPACAPEETLLVLFHVQIYGFAFDGTAHIVGDGIAVPFDIKQRAKRNQFWIHGNRSEFTRQPVGASRIAAEIVRYCTNLIVLLYILQSFRFTEGNLCSVADDFVFFLYNMNKVLIITFD